MKCLEIFSYNIYIAKLFGINSAVFLSCLSNAQLDSVDSDISLSREDIYKRTGLNINNQSEVESTLSNCGIISIKPFRGNPDKNHYVINSDIFNRVICSSKPEDILVNSTIKPFEGKPKINRVSKKQSHIDKLKKSIKIEDQIIAQYLCDWIDSVYTNPKGFLSLPSISIAEQELLNFSNDQSVQIEILKIAIKGGLRDLTWAIDSYKKLSDTKTAAKAMNNFVLYSEIKSNGEDVVDEEF